MSGAYQVDTPLVVHAPECIAIQLHVQYTAKVWQEREILA